MSFVTSSLPVIYSDTSLHFFIQPLTQTNNTWYGVEGRPVEENVGICRVWCRRIICYSSIKPSQVLFSFPFLNTSGPLKITTLSAQHSASQCSESEFFNTGMAKKCFQSCKETQIFTINMQLILTTPLLSSCYLVLHLTSESILMKLHQQTHNQISLKKTLNITV